RAPRCTAAQAATRQSGPVCRTSSFGRSRTTATSPTAGTGTPPAGTPATAAAPPPPVGRKTYTPPPDLYTISLVTDELRGLPPTFTFGEAMHRGLGERKLYRLREAGLIHPVGRGLHRRHDAAKDVDLDLLEVAIRAPEATLCLTTALARHDLVDAIPSTIDVAIPRGRRKPAVSAAVSWHL